MDLDNILIPLYEAEVKKLRTILKRRRFEFAERTHAHFTAKKGRLHVTVYENGPLFPALRSGPTAGSGAYPKSKFLAAKSGSIMALAVSRK